MVPLVQPAGDTTLKVVKYHDSESRGPHDQIKKAERFNYVPRTTDLSPTSTTEICGECAGTQRSRGTVVSNGAFDSVTITGIRTKGRALQDSLGLRCSILGAVEDLIAEMDPKAPQPADYFGTFHARRAHESVQGGGIALLSLEFVLC
jgi:hypothetical protein